MAFTDFYAADRLKQLHEARGLSPETLASEIALLAEREGWTRGAVDAHTIRRIEDQGHVPGPRIMFVLAYYFDLVPHEIWMPSNRRLKVAA